MAGILHRDGLQAAVDLAGDVGEPSPSSTLEANVRLAPAKQRGQHLAGLVAIVVDGLLAQDDEVGLFLATTPLRILATASGSVVSSVLTRIAAVGAHGERGAQRFLRLAAGPMETATISVGLAGFLQRRSPLRRRFRRTGSSTSSHWRDRRPTRLP
jgi:hypothetical protein